MAILNIGLPKNKEAWQTNLGALATDLHNRMQEVRNAKTVLDATPDADLIALGFTQDEVTYMKSAIGELAGVAAGYFTGDTFAKHLRGVIGS